MMTNPINNIAGFESADYAGDLTASRELHEGVRAVLAGLGEREEIVLSMRFGIGGKPPCTLEDIARALGVSRERIRQIEAKALRKLRHPSRSQFLQSFLEGTSHETKRTANRG